MFQFMSRRRRSGFTLIELAIVLGVVGVLSAGLWRILSSGSQQTKDQAVAQQHLALINAVQGFLADVGTTAGSGQYWLTNNVGVQASGAQSLSLPTSNNSLADCQGHISASYVNLCNYLPPGFTSSTTNAYGQVYSIKVLGGPTVANQNYSFMIITYIPAGGSGTLIPDADGGRISALIGADGGFIYKAAVCTASASTVAACGTLGGWTVSNIDSSYGYVGGASGEVASRSFAGSATNSSYFWLARQLMPGDNTTTTNTYNSMATPLFMGTGTVSQDIYMGPVGANPGTGNIWLSNGIIHGDGASNAQLDLAAPADTSVNLAQLTIGCSLDDGVTCPGSALYIGHGDIYLSNGRVTAQKLYSASDARLKTNIHPIADPLGDLMKIDAVSFAFKKGGSQSMGVTAQNLEKVYPQLVSEDKGTKFVEYNGLIGPLIGAVQELKRQNDDLREQLHQQKLREDRLEKGLNNKNAAP